MNKTCVVTFFYPGIENKINNFFASLKNQSDQKFDLIIILNNKKKFNIPNNKFNIIFFKMNKSIVLSRFEMIKKLKKLSYSSIIFQDADDLMKFNRVEACKKILKKHDIVVNDLDIFGKKYIKNYLSKRIKNNKIITFKDIIQYNFLGMSNTSVKKKCLDKIKIPINKKIKIFDWYFWSIILFNYKGVFTNKTSTKYYVNKKSATCLPTIANKKIYKKILSIKKLHHKTISKLIKNKKLKKNNLFNKNSIPVSSKYNFWWEKIANV